MRLRMPIWLRTTLVAALVLVAGAAMPADRASADPGAATYSYVIGTGLLCGLDPSACPVIAMAPNGDTAEITGDGTFSIHPKAVTGGGTFTHNFAGGGAASGTWTADALLGFHGYGCGGSFPPDFCGGLALIRVTLSVGGTPVASGVMQVDCLIGDKVPAGATEGVRLALDAGINFNEEVSGFTLFVLD